MGATDPSLESDPDLGHVGNEADGSAQHLMFDTLNGVSLDADHLPADLLERQDLGRVERGSTLKLRLTKSR